MRCTRCATLMRSSTGRFAPSIKTGSDQLQLSQGEEAAQVQGLRLALDGSDHAAQPACICRSRCTHCMHPLHAQPAASVRCATGRPAVQHGAPDTSPTCTYVPQAQNPVSQQGCHPRDRQRGHAGHDGRVSGLLAPPYSSPCSSQASHAAAGVVERSRLRMASSSLRALHGSTCQSGSEQDAHIGTARANSKSVTV